MLRIAINFEKLKGARMANQSARHTSWCLHGCRQSYVCGVSWWAQPVVVTCFSKKMDVKKPVITRVVINAIFSKYR